MNSPLETPPSSPGSMLRNSAFDGPRIIQDLKAHLALCQEVLDLTERQHELLHAPAEGESDLTTPRKALLLRLNQSVECLRHHRVLWQQTSVSERSRFPEIGSLLRANQDLIMKVVVLDRENEQAWLRRGLVPARHLPPAAAQRPHYVSEMYRRAGVR